MLKSVTTKIFAVFAVLVVLEGLTLSIVLGRLMIRETETYVLDSLSLRSQVKAEEIQKKLSVDKSNISAVIAKDPAIFLLSQDGSSIESKIPKNFDLKVLRSLAPRTGSSVTECADLTGENYFCSFSSIPQSSVWIFESLPQGSIFQIFEKLKFQIAGFLMIWLSLSIALTYLSSRLLLRPLQQFIQVSERVATGNFQNAELPTDRLDEIGDLARSLFKMTNQLKQREFYLSQSAQQLVHSARLASVGQMGASIAHEVKNPLMAMIGYAKILLNKSNDQDIKEAAEIIYKESERCSQILSQMLKFSRNESAESRPFKLQEVIDSTLLLLRADAKSRGVTISYAGKTDAVLVGKGEQIQQVLLNLLINAVQASPADSSVELKCTDQTDSVKIQVSDHGAGIPLEIQNNIFDPFFTTKNKRDGTGLGLSVAQDIVRQHGGEIAFESKPGTGTIFSFSLPQG